MGKKANTELVYHYAPSLIGKQVEAQYTPQVICGYKNNPFIEALPPIFEEEYVATHVGKYPDYKRSKGSWGSKRGSTLFSKSAIT